MIQYKIQCKNPASQFVELELTLHLNEAEQIKLQLPAWRAGRYQLANYAQNIRNLTVFDSRGDAVLAEKISKDCWVFHSQNEGAYRVCYDYYCGKMDAGSAWVDDEQVYLNLVNCCFEVLGKSETEIELTVDLPEYPNQISTLIPVSASVWKAANFQMLADSTLLACQHLTQLNYLVGKTQFHIWTHGKVHFDLAQFLTHFQAFSNRLIQDFGEFPEQEYHFIFQLLPYPHYHGVEHRRGTVVTFGPAESLRNPEQMEELLGVSCHELYHAWNVCRIRPKELLPYDFSKETYTKAGLLLEGVTTYMGDLYLLKSGVYYLQTYLRHFEKLITREASSFGWRNQYISQSSFDLWLDGYVPGIPDRKVNIYTRGALLAFSLDVLLIQQGTSLVEIMTEMWKQFGKQEIGYSLEDFDKLVLEKFPDQTEITAFFSDFVYGNKDLFPVLQGLFRSLGIQMAESYSPNWLLHDFGVRTNPEGSITQLHPDAKSYSTLMRNDRILNWPSEKTVAPRLEIDRLGRNLQINLMPEKRKFFPEYSLKCERINPITKKWYE